MSVCSHRCILCPQGRVVQLYTLSILLAEGSRCRWLSGQASPPPPAVSEERPHPLSSLLSQTPSSLKRGRIFMNLCVGWGGPHQRLQHRPRVSQAPITTNQKQTLSGVATHCMFGSHSFAKIFLFSQG